MKVVFISGPYRANAIHNIVNNIRNAEAVAIELWRMGFAVITPHLNTRLLDGACADGVWLEGALELLRRSDIIVLIPGWQKSPGARAELRESMARGMPVFRWPEQSQELKDLDK